MHRIEVNTKRKADKSRKFRRITRKGIVNPRAEFVSDIDKEMEVPVCDVDSDDISTSEDEQGAVE